MPEQKPLVAIVMGSKNDAAVMKWAAEVLKDFGVPYIAKVESAHRTPDRMAEFAKSAKAAGFKIIIAGAGGSAHLPGMMAAHSTLPVFGVPIPSESNPVNDTAAIWSIGQMPQGVTVAAFPMGGRSPDKPSAGAYNAALMAVEVLALFDPALDAKYAAWRQKQTDDVKEEIDLI